jgi:hypothetical protein
MFAGDEREGLGEIISQFVGRASFAGIIAGDSETAAKGGVGIFEAADVITLPAMEGDRNARQLGEGFANIDAMAGVAVFGESE